MLPAVRSSAPSIISRSSVSTAAASVVRRRTATRRRVAPLVGAAANTGDSRSGVIRPPGSAIATARCTSLRSWRTLPGQANASNRSSVSGLEANARLAEPLGGFAEEERAQVRDLLAAIAQRRHVDADHAQAVEQILAELAVGDALLEIGVGRGDDPDVDPLRARVADRQHLALLEEPQQLRLHVERQVADFVEEQRAADAPSGARPAGRRSRR